MKGFQKAKKPTNKELMEENVNLKVIANKRIDKVAKAANNAIFETGQDLASAECMVMMLKDLVHQVANKHIYPHELRIWLTKFEDQENFEGTNEELADSLGLSNLKRDYAEIYLEVEKRIANRLLDLEVIAQLNKE